MKICHDDPTAGHLGHKKTLTLVQRKYYWPKMNRDVKDYVEGCDICQRTKARRRKPAGEMQALSLPAKPFESISLNFITDLPPSKDSVTGNVVDSLLVIVDRYTKEAEYIPCLKTTDAPMLAQLFIRFWFKDHGLPASIISDRGSVFTSRFWKELCFHLGITRGLSTAFHPQTDGQTERQNQAIESWLRCYICYQQDNWTDLLPLAKFAYMNAPQESIGIAPNEARYGMLLETRQGIEDDPQRGEIPIAKERAEEIIEIRKQLEISWQKTKESQAKWYNKNHRPLEFKEGDMVLLSSKNIKTVRTSKKLDHRFLGPFPIKKRIGRQAYRLKLPVKYSRPHDVFHVSLLEPYQQRPGESLDLIQPDLVDGEEE
jgi:transposase InsO family protein